MKLRAPMVPRGRVSRVPNLPSAVSESVTVLESVTVSQANWHLSLTETTVVGDAFDGTVIPNAPGSLSTTFTLTSATTQTAPFSIGHAFKQGDVSAIQDIAVTNATAQVVYKNAWPDGSRKFAIISGTASLVANVPKTVNIDIGTASSGSALTTANLKTAMSGQTCSIACGAFGTVSWATTDFDSPFQTWVSGAQMSSWIYRKPVGSDAHLVGWLEVRLFLSGAVEVLPWIENGYLLVASPSNKSDTYTFTLGSTSRFSAAINLLNHQRTPLVSNVVSHWLGTDPGVTPQHNQAYMQSTKLVPAYFASVATSSPSVAALTTTFTPLQQGQYTDPMGTGGYNNAIGIIPEWDVLYLTSASTKPWKAMQWNAYSSGRYGHHFRDETTNRPIAFSSYPHLVLDQTQSHSVLFVGTSTTGQYTPAATGPVPPEYDLPHVPAFAYAPYLMTGRWYFMEETQFSATIHFLMSRDDTRGGWDGVSGTVPYPTTAGIFQSSSGQMTTRGAAWALRTLGQAWNVTPDSDTLKSEFLNSISYNAQYLHAKYIAQPSNPLGLVQPYLNYPVNAGAPLPWPWFEAGWQHDFHSMSVGFLKSVKPNLITADQTKLDAFYAWHGNNAVGRLGGTGSTEWLYRDAAPYTIAVSPTSGANPHDATTGPPKYIDGTGPWFSDFGAAYAASYAGQVGTYEGPWNALGPKVIGDGSIRNGLFADSFFANMWPAIAYAVQHGLTGAQAAYNRMVGASNWNSFLTLMNDTPIWGVKPPGASSGTRPAWRTSMAQWEWKALSGTTVMAAVTGSPGGTSAGIIDAYCGLAGDQSTGKLYSVAAGGHGDWAGNGVYVLDMNTAAPAWVQLRAPTAAGSVTIDTATYADGRPSSSHLYWASAFTFGKPVRFGAGAQWGTGGGNDLKVVSFNLSTNDWDTAGTYADLMPLAASAVDALGRTCCKNESNGDVYLVLQVNSGPVYKLIKYDGTTGARTDLGAMPVSGWNKSISAVDTTRNRLVLMHGPSGGQGIYYDIGTATWSSVFTVTAPITLQVSGIQYGPSLDRFLLKSYAAAGVYLIHPTTFVVTAQTVGGVSVPDAHGLNTVGIYNRAYYLPNLGGLAYYPESTSGMYFLATD